MYSYSVSSNREYKCTLVDYTFYDDPDEEDKEKEYEVSMGLRPVFTLKSTVKVTGGSGTSASPYILGI